MGTKLKNTNVVPSAIAGFGATRDRNVFPMRPKGMGSSLYSEVHCQTRGASAASNALIDV